MCLALMFAIQKLRHYMHAYTIHLVAKADPIIYVPAKAIKGQTLADFLADHPIPADWKISDDLPDEEVFYIDIFPTWMIELCSNNVAEYQALIIGLQMAINMEIIALEIYGDSKLIINQLLTEYEVRKDDLVPYFRLATQLLQRFEAVTLEHVPRKENQMADALTNLASSITLREDEATNVPVYQRWVIPPVTEMVLSDTNVISILLVNVEEWRQPLINYLEHGILPDDPKHRSEARKKPIKPWKKHTQEYVERITTSWPFDAWGLDVVGPIAPKSSTGEAYILAATDYFSKWAETIPLKEVKKETVFSNRLVDELCEKYKFKQHKSSMYHAPANSLAEAFNKTLCNLLKKVIGRIKKDWHERIGETLWAYMTTYRTPTQATPYSLVYGVEAVLPLESQIPSLRMALQEGLTDEENAKLRLQELEALDEKRLEAQQHLECYQARLSKAFNKKVFPRSFQMGDLVLSLRRPIITTHKTKSKFTSKWDRPYVIQEVYTNGAYLIMAEDGLKIGPINGRFLKR
ncbi:hypothetical protein COP1_022238 [Malus domestica]